MTKAKEPEPMNFTARKRLPVAAPFSIGDVEKDIAEIVSATPTPAPVELFAPKNGLPDYVEHLPGVDEIGRLTAEAVVKEYEATAKEIEATTADLLDAQRRCEAETAKLQQVVEELKDVAQRYRDEGKRAFEQIERLSQMTADARQACTDLRSKITTV